jgi:endo-1,4-beta-xylanase
MSASRSSRLVGYSFLLFWCSLVLLFFLIGASSTAPNTLRQAADQHDLLVGTAVRPTLLHEPAYAETLSREFNMIEPEDALKWSVIRKEEGAFDFSKADEIVHFAQAHGMKVRGHCLVWDHDNPQWLVDGSYAQAEMSRLLHDHIATVMQHYAGQVFAWDVVNEALDDDGTFKDSPWYNKPGIALPSGSASYVEEAFRWAHDVDSKALLFYNDNRAEVLNRKSDAVYAMMKEFKRRKVPIDGVGLQMHLSRLDFDTDALAANINRLAALGLQVHITEMDVSLPLNSTGRPEDEDLRLQANLYGRVIRVCRSNPRCTAIQTWGFTDKYSWIGSHSHGTRGAALLFDRVYHPKPAYFAWLEALQAAIQPVRPTAQ